MRIVLNVQESRDKNNKRVIKVRAGYNLDSKDDVRVRNCGVDLYNQLASALTGTSFTGGIVELEGERR